jgi:hypothetical protein
MVFVKRGKSTMKQQAYARRVFSGDGANKKQIALDVGFSPNVARSVVTHIENKPGFHNAMSKLAFESNNLALSAIEQFKARGFDGFSNKEMIDALGAISKAWAQFNLAPQEKSLGNTSSTNKLRTIIMNQIENQTVVQSDKPLIEQKKEVEKPNLDF